MLITGMVLLVIAIALFAIGFTGAAKVIGTPSSSPKTISLSPGDEILIGSVEAGTALGMVYNDSLNKPLGVNYTSPGYLSTTQVDGLYVVTYAPLSGVGDLYLVNNYTTTVSVTYRVISISASSGLITSGVMIFLSIVIGIVGLILTILGAVLKPRH